MTPLSMIFELPQRSTTQKIVSYVGSLPEADFPGYNLGGSEYVLPESGPGGCDCTGTSIEFSSTQLAGPRTPYPSWIHG